jgi:hypothetical protein
MDRELDEKLCSKYPLIFADRHRSMMETAMCWGFECGNGWYDLIDTLCERIQLHIESTNRHREIMLAKPTGYIPEEVPQVVAVQVKEKFGMLRFYYDGGDEHVRGLVNMAEAMSIKICMTCGKPGVLYTSGWWNVACEEHKID